MINEQLIRNRISNLIDANRNEQDVETAVNNFKEELASIIIDSIKSATVTIQTGAIVTVGSPTSQSNVAPILLNVQ